MRITERVGCGLIARHVTTLPVRACAEFINSCKPNKNFRADCHHRRKSRNSSIHSVGCSCRRANANHGHLVPKSHCAVGSMMSIRNITRWRRNILFVDVANHVSLGMSLYRDVERCSYGTRFHELRQPRTRLDPRISQRDRESPTTTTSCRRSRADVGPVGPCPLMRTHARATQRGNTPSCRKAMLRCHAISGERHVSAAICACEWIRLQKQISSCQC